MLSALPAPSPAGWMSQGACQGEDPEIFFPIATTGPALDQISAAKAICRRCAVRQPCLSYAAATMQDGIWGGTTRDERRALRGPPFPHNRQAAGRPAADHDVRPARGTSHARDDCAARQGAGNTADGFAQ